MDTGSLRIPVLPVVLTAKIAGHDGGYRYVVSLLRHDISFRSR